MMNQNPEFKAQKKKQLESDYLKLKQLREIAETMDSHHGDVVLDEIIAQIEDLERRLRK